jgi:sulfate adenylyltransferase
MSQKYILLNDRQICDLEMILCGAFSPLQGFMDQRDYTKVLNDMRLYDGTLWPLPVTLTVKEDSYTTGENVILCNQDHGHLASMTITDIYRPNIQQECLNAYGTDDTNHPYVKILMEQGGMWYLGGKVSQINSGIQHFDYQDIRMTPAEVKNLLSEKYQNPKTVIGFQTRNPMHRSHFELTQKALRDSGDPDAVLFLNPVVGITQDCDIEYHTRVKCYKELMKYYNQKTTILSLLPLSMRMAGPKEALLHAIVRKNYGCTHFIVGRDHAGPSFKSKEGNSFYGPYEAQELFQKHAEEIGIIPLTSKMMVYVKNKQCYLPMDETTETDTVENISGTQQRSMLENNEPIPEWFTYPEISKILKEETTKKGFCIYLVGLSGAGKTTLSNAIKQKLQELTTGRTITILDGDIIRKNLSKGLGFSREDRSTNVRRIGYVATEIVKHGGIVLCANIAPYEEDRQFNRNSINQYGEYIEVFMDTPLSVCEERDIKGLYNLARNGVIKEFTGISDPFDVPTNSELTFGHKNNVQNCVDNTIQYLKEKKLL